MAALKKNIWLLFNIIAGIGIVLSLVLSVKEWNNINDQARHEQESLVRMASASVSAHIDQYKMLLSTLDKVLVENENYTRKHRSRELLSNVLNSNDSIADIGLFDIRGQQFFSTHSDENLANISHSPSFKKYLNSSEMVIGRTFKHPERNKYYIPFAKVLRDNRGKPVAIIIFSVHTQDGLVLMNRSDAKHTERPVSVLHEEGFYFMLVPFDTKVKGNPYAKPLPPFTAEQLRKAVQEDYGLSSDDVKSSQQIVSVKVDIPRLKTKTLTTTEYIKDYDLWVTMHRPASEIRHAFYPELLMIWGMYAAVIAILYLLFREIYRFQENKRHALEYQANHDYLTQLHNRYFLSGITRSLESDEEPFWLIFFDINSFKSINTNYGHQYGDKVLKQVADRLRLERDGDLIVRYSGNEFILITYKSREDMLALAHSVQNSLERVYNIDGHSFTFRFNMGIAGFPEDGSNFEMVKKHAYWARFESKKNAHQLTLCNNNIKAKYQELNDIEVALRKAIAEDRLYMVYQPQVNKNGVLTGIESLVRWEDEKLGFIPPDKFIAVAENADLMPELGKYILQKSLSDAVFIQGKTDHPFGISINISVMQFMEPDFFETLIKIADSSGIEPSRITLEITESIFIDDTEYVLSLLGKLKRRGFKIALDDFGTGYSSLSMLQQLPLNELKLDKSFIDNIAVDETAKEMVSSIINIGKSLELKLVAEGIEDIKQKEVLDQFGCDLYQGYYFSRPLKKELLCKNPYVTHCNTT